MGKSPVKLLLRSVIVGVVWAAVLIGIGFWIERSTQSAFVDILFFEGGIFIILGGLSLMGGIPVGVSSRGMGEKDSQYITNIAIDVEVVKKEKEASAMISKNKLSYAFNAISLMVGGGICIIIDIIMVA